MAKPKDKATKARKADAQSDAAAADPASWAHTARETIESIVIAFVLAFLFRTFEAEAFVIPTGSMAPTLMGRHMDLNCPKCGFGYQAGPVTSDEDKTPAQELGPDAACPLCGYRFKPDEKTPYYNGDRILVNKFAFDFAEPQRWDVIVFKFPEDAKTNYIKRLIGLPGEVIRIRNGDIMVSRDGGKTFGYVPRTPAKLKAMMQIVYDNDYAYEPFIAKGWPQRWQSVNAGWANGKQSSGAIDYKSFDFNPKSAGADSGDVAWLRYLHFLPGADAWQAFDNNEPLDKLAHDQPITDAIAYDRTTVGNNGVSDLAVECQVNVAAPSGKLLLELVKNGGRFDCEFDLSTGAVSLAIPGFAPAERPKAATGGISKAGSYRLMFANIDHQLTLMVDGKQVQFDKPAVFDGFDDAHLVVRKQSAELSAPVSIGSNGAAISVSHLRVMRDIYYTFYDSRHGYPPPHPDYRDIGGQPAHWPDQSEWYCLPRKALAKLRDADADVRPNDQFFFVGQDQFFPMGDNSPSSQDGRFWLTQHHFDENGKFLLTTRSEDDFNFVDRRLLVGKALYIYWPHSFFFPIPNFGRMGFVR